MAMNILQKISTALSRKLEKQLAKVPVKNDIEAAKQLVMRGNQLEDSGNYQEALSLYEQAIDVAPESVVGYLNRGNVLVAANQNDLAIRAYLKALEIQPDHATVHFNLGNVYQRKGAFEPALLCYEKSLEYKPDFVDAWVAHGNALGDLKRLELAIDSYKKALSLNPNYAEIYRNLATCFYALGRFKEAKESFQSAIDLKSNLLGNYCSLANVYREMGKVGQAVEMARNACTVDPTSAGAHSLLLFCLSHSPDTTRKSFFQDHLEFGRKFDLFPTSSEISFTNDKSTDRILKVGIVSGDLRSHAVASFFGPIYERLLKIPTLIIYIYDAAGVDDYVSQRMKELIIPGHWIDVVLMNDIQLDHRIRSDAIDILIDLSGHTPGHRLPVFAKKPAPVQMSWIGYPGTTGLRAMDYYIADRHYLPPGEFDDIFVEKILRLPATTPFSSIENIPDVNSLPALTNGYFTFGSFNRLDKISKEVVGLWAKLLAAVPDSKMLIGGMPAAGGFDEVVAWFNEFGIGAERLTFHRRSDMYNYLLLHHQVDVCIDTFPYGASTTSCHALSMGVPTITLVGDIPASVSGRAFLSQIGLTNLFVAQSHDEFLQKGIWCAASLTELAQLRLTLRPRFQSSNVMQPKIIADALEFSIRYAWQRWCQSLPATAFETVQFNDGFEVIDQ